MTAKPVALVDAEVRLADAMAALEPVRQRYEKSQEEWESPLRPRVAPETRRAEQKKAREAWQAEVAKVEAARAVVTLLRPAYLAAVLADVRPKQDAAVNTIRKAIADIEDAIADIAAAEAAVRDAGGSAPKLAMPPFLVGWWSQVEKTFVAQLNKAA